MRAYNRSTLTFKQFKSQLLKYQERYDFLLINKETFIEDTGRFVDASSYKIYDKYAPIIVATNLSQNNCRIIVKGLNAEDDNYLQQVFWYYKDHDPLAVLSNDDEMFVLS